MSNTLQNAVETLKDIGRCFLVSARHVNAVNIVLLKVRDFARIESYYRNKIKNLEDVMNQEQRLAENRINELKDHIAVQADEINALKKFDANNVKLIGSLRGSLSVRERQLRNIQDVLSPQ